MDVVELRRNIENKLRNELSSDAHVVNYPDHPFLLHPPDLLVGSRHGLLAILCATKAEARQPNKALARFALCRAALPPETTFAFISQPDTEKVAHVLSDDVQFVADWRKLSDLAKFVDDAKTAKNLKLIEQERLFAIRRFGSTYSVAQRLNNRIARSPSKSAQREKLRPKYLSTEQSISPRINESLPSTVAQLTLLGARDFFHLDNGVAYVSRGSSGVVYTDIAPKYQGDPDKFLRASAFSGWTLLPRALENDRQRVEDMIIHFTAFK